ncbi:MAG: hypothetical protein MJZ10_09380 [Fibrobacter sp.]|nr:hypothetical protein [Fibrobacter sp.]
MMVSALEKNFITEVATGMVAEVEVSLRIGTARREGREEGREAAPKKSRCSKVTHAHDL